MRLETASAKAIRYACLHFHYAKSVPSAVCSFSVFNDDGEWCGVIVFGAGANNHLAGSVEKTQGAVCELVRVALNGKQENTGKAVSLSLKLLRKKAPLCQIVVSYADPAQGHLGIIYQATNWIYLGKMKSQTEYMIAGKQMHGRSVMAKFGTIKGKEKVKVCGKRKYAFGLTDDANFFLKKLSKPYPKRVQSIVGDVTG